MQASHGRGLGGHRPVCHGGKARLQRRCAVGDLAALVDVGEVERHHVDAARGETGRHRRHERMMLPGPGAVGQHQQSRPRGDAGRPGGRVTSGHGGAARPKRHLLTLAAGVRCGCLTPDRHGGIRAACSAARKRRMRRALLPVSVVPCRAAERTSTRVPAPQAVNLTTMSSVNPNHHVVSVASIRPSTGSLATMVQPRLSAMSRARSKHEPRRLRDDEWGQFRIVLALEQVHLAGAGQRMAVCAPTRTVPP